MMEAARPRPQHAPLLQFAVEDDCLLSGGIPLPRLAARVGQTPFYAYSRAAMTQRVAELRAALPPDVHLHYAMKANPSLAIAQALQTFEDGDEIRTVLGTGMSVAG